MAWDALASRFQKKRTEEDKGMGAEAQPTTSGGGFSGGAPVADPTGGFGGNAGSTSGGPVSAGFVNYADLYSANEEKAKSMASNVYRGAEKKAEGAKDALQTARDQFAGAVNQGTGKGPEADKFGHQGRTTGAWKPGTPTPEPKKHGVGETGSGVKVTANAGPVATPDTKPASTMWTGGTGQVVVDNSAGPGQDEYTTKDKALYGSLMGYGNFLGKQQIGWNPDTGAIYSEGGGRAGPVGDGFDVLGAQSGAGQDYTGPESLKDHLGEEGYSALGEKVREGSEAVSGLQDAGGIAEALGYAGTETGNAAMDAGLAQTAGQAAFKKLKERYGGLGQSLKDAQADSEKAAKGAGIMSDVAAQDWQDMLDQYEAEQNKPAAEQPPTYEESRDAAWNMTRLMDGWAGFTGANGNKPSEAFKTASDAGYTTAQIFEAYKKWTEKNGSKTPSADDLLLILTSGGY